MQPQNKPLMFETQNISPKRKNILYAILIAILMGLVVFIFSSAGIIGSIIIIITIYGMECLLSELFSTKDIPIEGKVIKVRTPYDDDQKIWRLPITVQTKDGDYTVALQYSEYKTLMFSYSKDTDSLPGETIQILRVTSVMGSVFYKCLVIEPLLETAQATGNLFKN